jgi:rRNA biogenesis protein RRP5
MSETFIENPQQHFRLGQTVTVKVISVNPDSQEMKVTCKDSSTFGEDQEEAWNKVSGGDLLEGTVTVKTAETVSVELENGLRGLIRIGHLTDSSAAKCESAMKRIRVGQKLSNLLVLDRHLRSQTVLLSNKPSMIEDASAGRLIRSFSDARKGLKVHAFVRNITDDAVYAEFVGGTVGMVPRSQLLPEMATRPAFGLRKDQTLTLWVSDADAVRQKFLLTMREQAVSGEQPGKMTSAPMEILSKPIDTTIKSMADLSLGKVIKARIASVKATQINVRLADNVQGRVDVSEVFDTWEDISNKAAPLQKFKQNDVIDVKVLGIHDARNHRFLPISHRQGKVPVFELSAKKSRVQDDDESLLSLDTVKPGSSHLAFVNNHGDNCVWVNLSPNVRGRVALMDLSDDVGQLQNVENRFRVGCALNVKVKAVDVGTGRLDLTARRNESAAELDLKDLQPGMVLPARVMKSAERAVTVQFANDLVCHVPLVELGDDYDQVNPAQFNKNAIVRACVVGIDAPNKRAFLSLRPSKVLSSSLPVKDTHITDVSQLKTNQLVRGFVKKVTDKGVFISLGADIDALVRITDLSDQYVKDWRSIYEVDQLVQGRVLTVDVELKQVRLSLKQSQVGGSYEPPLTINDLEVGMTVTGKVRKVEDFGAFIDIDNTHPRISGLCHRSEVAAKRIEDVRKLYSAGDVVQAKVLSVDVDSRKISLGLKASYFNNEVDDDMSVDESVDDDAEMEGGVELEDDSEGGISIDLGSVKDEESDAGVDAMDTEDDIPAKPNGGLKTNGFDWSGAALDADANGAAYESEPETTATKKRKRNKPEIKEDRTGDLDKNGPQSNDDFERQLLGQPNKSDLWVEYMAFQLKLSEVQKARDIAERALRTIHIRETDEKMTVWIAWLNLEVEYGDDESVEEVFKQACQVQDSLEMHERLASIYIDSGRHAKAEGVFERIIGNKAFRASPDVWVNYATFLFNSLHQPDRARDLLAKGSKVWQSVPGTEHRALTSKFGALEFRSEHGNPERGRTIFENLLAEWPKWSSGWDMWVDLERSRVTSGKLSGEQKQEAMDKTRALYERLSRQKMKKRRAKFVFKKWLEFEEAHGNGKSQERVKVLAREYVEKLNEKAGAEEDEE